MDEMMSEGLGEGHKDVALKKAVELLRGGATLLSEVCPVCKSPLFRLRSGEVVCPVHGRIMLVKTEEEVAEAGVLGTLTELEKRISRVLMAYMRKLDLGEASHEDARDIVYWLDAIERIERVKQMLKQSGAPVGEKRGGKEESRGSG